ncbi:type II toxin-antitoxin system VapC family toxin [Desulfothermus sp.]
MGVILFRHRKELIYFKFIVDVVSKVKIVSLSLSSYKELVQIRERYNLDFDDAYQFQISIEKGLKIITMDKDFDRVRGVIEVINV